MVSEVIAKLKRGRSISGCTEDTLDESPKEARREYYGRKNCVAVGRCAGVCGVEGVSGWKRALRDCTQNCSSEQVFGEMETSAELIMAPEEIAPGHCEIHSVAGTSLELKRLDNDQSSERQNCELERENGGECDWSEQATMDGNGPVVENVAQNRTSLDREMQHEPDNSNQRERY